MTSRFTRIVAMSVALTTAVAFSVPLTVSPARADGNYAYVGGYGGFYGRHGGGYKHRKYYRGDYGYGHRYYGRRHYGYRHYRRHDHGDAVAGAIFGLAAGALIAGALSQPRYYSRPSYSSTTYGYRPQPWSDEWYDYCARKYRSFDPASGTFQPYNGPRRLCR